MEGKVGRGSTAHKINFDLCPFVSTVRGNGIFWEKKVNRYPHEMYPVYISSVHFAYLDLMTPLGSRSEKSKGNGLSADGSDLDRNRRTSGHGRSKPVQSHIFPFAFSARIFFFSFPSTDPPIENACFNYPDCNWRAIFTS